MLEFRNPIVSKFIYSVLMIVVHVAIVEMSDNNMQVLLNAHAGWVATLLVAGVSGRVSCKCECQISLKCWCLRR